MQAGMQKASYIRNGGSRGGGGAWGGEGDMLPENWTTFGERTWYYGIG